MVLIISEETDNSTWEVIKWLIFQEKKFYRINDSDKIRIENISLSSSGELDYTLIVNNNDVIKFSEISSVWYRRGALILNYNLPDFELPFLNNVNFILSQESNSFVIFLHYTLKIYKTGIGFFFDNFTNKLMNLKIASDCGLKIPKTLLCDNKKALIDFSLNTTELITKSGDTTFAFNSEAQWYHLSTSLFTKEDIINISCDFFPTLFQEKLNKKYEIRTFYLKGKCFSMAIFSQNDEQTKIDFRNYNKAKPNRTVPYQLPIKIEKAIKKFMQNINMNTGSVDIVYTVDNKYVFLEVNPVGQFKQVSMPCNYNLENLIANVLI